MMKFEIISVIDNIDDIRSNTEISVIESMVSFIDKGFVLYENKPESFNNEYLMFQEASVLDEVKKQEKKDSNKLISIIKFIPRIIIAFCKSLTNKFEKSDLGKRLKKHSKKLDKHSSKLTKQIKVNQINEEFKGQFRCYVDDKSGKIKFEKDGDSNFLGKLINTDNTVAEITELCDSISNNFDPANPSQVRSLIVKCNKIKNGDVTIKGDDIFENGIGAVGEILDNCKKSTGILHTLSDKIQYQFQKMYASEKFKTMPDKKRLEALKNCEELTNTVTQLITMANETVSFISRPLMRNLERLDGWLQKDTRESQDIFDFTVENIFNKYFGDIDFKAENPRVNGESQEAYETRISNIKKNKVAEFIKTPDGYAAWKEFSDPSVVTKKALAEWNDKKHQKAREKGRREEQTIHTKDGDVILSKNKNNQPEK